jgi:hypothetical protein
MADHYLPEMSCPLFKGKNKYVIPPCGRENIKEIYIYQDKK